VFECTVLACPGPPSTSGGNLCHRFDVVVSCTVQRRSHLACETANVAGNAEERHPAAVKPASFLACALPPPKREPIANCLRTAAGAKRWITGHGCSTKLREPKPSAAILVHLVTPHRTIASRGSTASCTVFHSVRRTVSAEVFGRRRLMELQSAPGANRPSRIRPGSFGGVQAGSRLNPTPNSSHIPGPRPSPTWIGKSMHGKPSEIFPCVPFEVCLPQDRHVIVRVARLSSLAGRGPS